MASSARIEELRKKFEENPRRYFAPLANEYRKAGDIEQAISICREYLPQQPGHMSGHIVYGQALYEARQFDEAKSVFETALTLDPENLIALRHLGDIALMVGDGDAARSWYKRVLEADPRNEEIQAQLARIDQSGAPTPVAGSPSAPTPAAGSATVPPITLVPSLSSAPTVVVDPSTLPPSKSVAATPRAPATPPESLSTTPTAEIHLDAPPLVEQARAPVDDASVQRLELDSPLPGASPEQAPIDSFSLAGLETTSLAAEPQPSPSTPPAPQPAPPALELDMPPSDALPGIPEAPASSPPLMEIELSAPDPELDSAIPAPEPLISAPAPSSPAEPELLDLSVPPPAAETAAPAAAAASTSVPPASVTPETSERASLLDGLPVISEPEPGAPPQSGPFVTETMAELYLQQGHRDEALRVYRALLEQRPSDAGLQVKIASLEAAATAAPTAAPTPRGGPTIREVLSLVATRKPGFRPSSHAGNGAVAPPPAAEPQPAHATAGPDVAGRSLGADLIGAFFGNKPVADADDAAARTLALAFSTDNGRGASGSDVSGSPARVAAKELSLDAVFSTSQAPAAPSNFSFDQFFSKNASADASPSAATTGADSQDDVAQFTSWLQGLKRK